MEEGKDSCVCRICLFRLLDKSHSSEYTKTTAAKAWAESSF